MEIHEIDVSQLPIYAAISIAFEVRSILRVEQLEGSLNGLRLVEEPVTKPYIKEYDYPGEDGPLTWGGQFDLKNWGFLLAEEAGEPVGGAAVAYATPEVYLLERRQDLAVLWDIRVQPLARRQGVGRQLFKAAAAWAERRGCRQMKIETQNVNVPACRFYAAQGCELGAIHRYAYTGHPRVGHEAMLLWYLDLNGSLTKSLA
jgi:GNAT superfamily N-acetyltransferase